MPGLQAKKIRNAIVVPPGSKVKLKDYRTDWELTEFLQEMGEDVAKEKAKESLAENLEALAAAQSLLYAADTHSVLIVLQAMDAAGKDGTIKHVMAGVNPQGCQVYSFKKPSTEELDHNFLWRYMRVLPERGRIGIFNRSYYEDVLVVKVHPELISPDLGKPDKKFWKRRYEDINALERHLTRNGTVVLKFFLHVSKKEQKRRFLDRLNDPEKHWKFSAADMAERAFWGDYTSAYEDCLSATSTKWAPWFVVPADFKWASRAIVAGVLTGAIRELGLEYPQVTEAKLKQMEEARKALEGE